MDLQKEKIAHEKHLLSQGVDFKYLPNIQYNELENVYELIEWGEEYSEALNEINSSWCTWQAAKAQAVPDGFVLVKMDDLELLRDSALDIKYASLSNDSDRIFSDVEDIQLSVERLIEAQEPTNE